MEAARKPDEGSEVANASDEELIRRFCASSPDGDAGEELARRCLPKLRKTIEKMVFAGSSLCPPKCDRHAFADDALSRASEYFLRGIPTFRFQGSFDGWLGILAKRAALDERRKVVGRQKESPPRIESLESLEGAGPVMPADHPLFRSKYVAHPAEMVRDREHREIVTALLTLHAQASDRDADSAWAIRLRMWDDRKVPEIAQTRGSSERDIWRLFAEDYPELQNLLITVFHLTTVRHV